MAVDGKKGAGHGAAGNGAASLRRGKLTLRGCGAGSSPLPENPLPLYRSPERSLPLEAADGFPRDKLESFGAETGFRLLPYRRQDRYRRELKPQALESVVLENDFLRAEFLPSLGGRLWSLYDKVRGRDLLYRNPVLRAANLAIRDAWFSGGVEWNLGRLGHAVHTCSPVFSGSYLDGDGSLVLRLWEFERQTRLYWRLEARLPPGSRSLLVYVRVDNPDPEDKLLYWWSNAAVPETEGVRVLCPSDEVIYMMPGDGPAKRMGGSRLPELPPLPGLDSTYPTRSDYANEYFVQCERSARDGFPYPWEAAAYEDGYAFAEASTAPLSYRKMFCWGRGPGGERWQDYLSLDGERYLEVQAGCAPSQLHSGSVGGGAWVDWVQAFGPVQGEAEKLRQKDYRAAAAYAEDLVAALAPPEALAASLLSCREASARNSGAILSLGSGWGRIEAARSGKEAPPGLLFPADSVGPEEVPWLELASGRPLPRRTPAQGPGLFCVDDDWRARLSRSEGTGGRFDWLTPYLLGVAAYEAGDEASARAAWGRSLDACPNAWAFRDLAVAAARSGRDAEALLRYASALDLGIDPAIAEEYAAFLLSKGLYEEAGKVASACGGTAPDGPLLEAALRWALEKGDDAEFDRLVSGEPARVREGNNALSDLWFEREARRLSAREGLAPEAARAKIKELEASGALAPPRRIDFRMSVGR